MFTNYISIQCLWTSWASIKDIIAYSSACRAERVSGWRLNNSSLRVWMGICTRFAVFNGCRWASASGCTQARDDSGWERLNDSRPADKLRHECARVESPGGFKWDSVRLPGLFLFLSVWNNFVNFLSCIPVWSYFGSTIWYDVHYLPKAAIWQIIPDLVIQMLCKPATMSHWFLFSLTSR